MGKGDRQGLDAAREGGVMNDPCPKCHGEGFTTAPYMLGLKTGDLYTITICACEAGQSKAAQIAAMTTEILEDENDHHN